MSGTGSGYPGLTDPGPVPGPGPPVIRSPAARGRVPGAAHGAADNGSNLAATGFLPSGNGVIPCRGKNRPTGFKTAFIPVPR